MPVLHVRTEQDRQNLRPSWGRNAVRDLVDGLEALRLAEDARTVEALVAFVGQADLRVDPDRAGTWLVHDEAERRWLAAGAAVCRAALAARGYPWDDDPPEVRDTLLWLLGGGSGPQLVVDPSASPVDLSDCADWMVVGRCRICGTQTYGLSNLDGELTVAGIERYGELAAAGNWLCDECDRLLCDCGERLRAPGDDAFCAECRAAFERACGEA